MPRNSLRFALPSLLGVLIFLTPVPWNGKLTIGIGIIYGWIMAAMGAYGLSIVVTLIIVAGVLTILGTVSKVGWIRQRRRLHELFDVPPVWLLLRLTGAIFGSMYLFQFGPQLLQSDGIGGEVYGGIAVKVLSVYIAACFLLPLLTEFGFMEFVGTLARPFFQKVFRLPGRAAIDAVASFVGASAIGLLITIGQYDRGNYSARHASVIATNFSVVSLPFSLVVATVAGIGELFLPWYGFVVLACLLAAFITPRLPPLSRKPDSYRVDSPERGLDTRSSSRSLLTEAWHHALQRAGSAPLGTEYLRISLANLAFFVFSVIPAAMALATVAALVTFHTPIFGWLGYPLAVAFELAGFPDAAAAAPGFFAGFMDQYMPALTAATIDSQATSFVLAGLSVCQLIFMSEVGVIILRSSLPISFAELVAIFLLRTAIVLPVLMIGAIVVVSL